MSTDLLTRLAELEDRVRAAIEGRESVDPGFADPRRALYLTPADARRVLDTPVEPVPRSRPAEEPGGRLGALAKRFGLDEVEVDFLLVAVAPDVDARFEALYGYLNDDITRRRPTVGLALRLCGLDQAGTGRFRVRPLVAGGLLEVVDPGAPALSRTLRVPDRVVAHLLGDDSPDTGLDVRTAVGEPGPFAERLRSAVAAGPVHIRDTTGEAHRVAVEALGTAVVVPPAALTEAVVVAAVREARLRDGGVVVGPLDAPPEGLRALLEHDVPLVFHSGLHWDAGWSPRTVLSLPLSPSGSANPWAEAITAATGEPADPEVVAAVGAYRVGSAQVEQITSVAARHAALDGRPLGLDHVQAGVRATNGSGLRRLARRITPTVTWDDLVLPEATRAQLAELAQRARLRDRVLGDWGMRPGGGRGRGVVALFAGESGTGKTMSAEVVAADLGMDLYVVDLATVVDKYLGETEKNLDRIFTEAERVQGVLLFDEADAVFGKRSKISDARDRYANLESAYLLSRLESFGGVAVLTTNLRSNVDDAFTRRLDVVAEFALPDARQREALWDRCLGAAMPRADDIDLTGCARRFELAGGSIRACAISAAYAAAADDRPVAMADLVAAVRQEYRKLGRLVDGDEFDPA
ncbi:ATP-binding protein [Actinokineospora terrae]|uniref:ATPase family associated with various cellular activities (AAA) n=1 Tax=Actinokineospora terrae TaxID=155974 RepID=A0A1H9T8J9_9PSEU|nr:ATP-binding protein [Actinokineospora terrae]SER93468.1 ATPase family associated with various cellular activities (AAA) [Actinokineospora terrae]